MTTARTVRDRSEGSERTAFTTIQLPRGPNRGCARHGEIGMWHRQVVTDAPVLPRLETDGRREELQQYSLEKIDNGSELVCGFARRCQASTRGKGDFAPGQLAHVGPHYELDVDGHPLRILVVSTQTARDEHHVTMDQRTAQIDEAKPTSARKFPRTPHLDGVALALKVLLGMDPEGEDELEEGVHVFDCFAMTNATQCTNVIDGKTGTATRDMFELCTSHLRRTISILQPTVIVAAGWQKTGESPASSVVRALGIPKLGRGDVIPVQRPWGTIAAAVLSHPSRQWPTAEHEVFKTEVVPALTRAREIIAVG